MSSHKRVLKRLLLLAGGLFVSVNVVATVAAQQLTQGYESDIALRDGMIVRLAPNDGGKVEAITQQEEKDMLGVVVPAGNAAVSLSNTEAEREIFVASGGQNEVLVSTQNGVIKTGDYITISSLAGIGMKAGSKQQYVLGKALQGFDGKTKTEGTATLTTNLGSKTVSLGRVPVELSIAHNPLYQINHIAGVPNILARMAEVVTDRPVTAFRIYASLTVTILGLLIAGIILFAGVRTGMVAIGRNPLARKSIFRNLVQVTLMALIVFVISAIAVYLLLRV